MADDFAVANVNNMIVKIQYAWNRNIVDLTTEGTSSNSGSSGGGGSLLSRRQARKARALEMAKNTSREEKRNEAALFDVLAFERENIMSFLASRARTLNITSLVPNPHSLPGTPLYSRFVESWNQVADQTVQLCFHGTKSTNIDAICKNGLDPNRRNGQAYGAGEYFAVDSFTSLGYCDRSSEGQMKMIVFAVLVDSSGLTPTPLASLLVINKVEHQLPLFVIEFGIKDGCTVVSKGTNMPDVDKTFRQVLKRLKHDENASAATLDSDGVSVLQPGIYGIHAAKKRKKNNEQKRRTRTKKKQSSTASSSSSSSNHRSCQ